MDNQSGISKGDITIRNTGSTNGNAVTPASTVTLQCGGSYSSAIIQVTGVYTGLLNVQYTLDGIRWETVTGATALVNMATKATSASIASAAQGIFQVDVAGIQGIRVTAIAGAQTGTATVSIQAGAGTGIVSIDAPISLAAGGQAIGTISTPLGTSLNVVTTATTNASNQKTTSGNLFELSISNPTVTAISVKLYNRATAPTVGTDVPLFTQTVAGGATVSVNFGQIGKRFNAGIGIAATALPAASDTGNAVAGVQINGSYV